MHVPPQSGQEVSVKQVRCDDEGRGGHWGTRESMFLLTGGGCYSALANRCHVGNVDLAVNSSNFPRECGNLSFFFKLHDL